METAREQPTGPPRKRTRPALEAGSPRSKSRAAAIEAPASPVPHWTFLTNHAHVIVLLSRMPSIVLREVASQVGITERGVQRIIADLEASGIIERERIGRQNRYRIRSDRPLRHTIEAHRTIGDLLALFGDPDE